MAGEMGQEYYNNWINPATGKIEPMPEGMKPGSQFTAGTPFDYGLGDAMRAANAFGAWGSFGNEAAVNRAGATLGTANLFDPYTYKPDAAAWQYTPGVDSMYRGLVAEAAARGTQENYTPEARAAQAQSRGEQANALAMLRDYATGNQSIARQQGALERSALANRIAGQVAARPYDPAAQRGGQMALASGSADLGAKTALAAAQEKLAAQQALMQGASGMRGADISQFGQESALEKSLRDYQTQKDSMAREWWKMGLGEKMAGMASAQDWEKQQIARNQYLQNMGARMSLGPEAQNVGQGTDWGGIAGGIGGVLSALAMAGMAFSDEDAKCGIIPSGEQCKRALMAGDAPIANFLENTQPSLAPVPAPSPVLSDLGIRQPSFAPMPSPAPAPTDWGLRQPAPIPEPSPALSDWGARQPSPALTDWGLRQPSFAPMPEPSPAPSPEPPPAPTDWGISPAAPTEMFAPGAAPAPSSPDFTLPFGLPQAAGPAVGKYGHDLWPDIAHSGSVTQQRFVAPETQSTDFTLPFGLPQPAGSGAWQQTAPPSGAGAWQQSDARTAQGPSLAPPPPAGPRQSVPPPTWTIPFADEGRSEAAASPALQPAARRGVIPEPMPKPVGLGTFEGLIFSDEQCKIVDDKIKQLELDGRGMTAEAQMWRTKLQKMQEDATEQSWRSEPMPDMGSLEPPGPEPRPSYAYQESAAHRGLDTLTQKPLEQQALTTTPGEAAYENAAEVAAEAQPAGSSMSSALPGAIGGLGKGIGGLLGALMPKQQQPARFHDVGTIPWQQMGGGPMGGIAQSLLSDISAKRGMQPTDRRLDEFLGEIEPTQFRYKEPFASTYGAGKRTGVIAQDVAKSELGDDMVLRDPQSGLLMLDTRPDKFNPLVLASLAHLAHRLDRVEGGK